MYKKLLDDSKKIILESLKIKKKYNNKKNNYYFLKELKKELKSDIDIKIENKILKYLKKTQINILSEEKGIIEYNKNDKHYWILDPVDGTYNYEKKIGPSTISLALYKGRNPIFGVIGLYPENKIVYGGKNFKSHYDNNLIKVSNISKYDESTLFTGFPSRLKFDNYNLEDYNKFFTKFKKIRMIGSASYSIFNICNGKAEYYYEKNIMIWDVAAALAILQGSGGKFKINNIYKDESIELHATNKKIKYLI